MIERYEVRQADGFGHALYETRSAADSIAIRHNPPTQSKLIYVTCDCGQDSHRRGCAAYSVEMMIDDSENLDYDDSDDCD